MYQQRGWAFFGVPGVSPMHEGNESGGEVAPFGGENILVANRALLVGLSSNDLMVDELV